MCSLIVESSLWWHEGNGTDLSKVNFAKKVVEVAQDETTVKTLEKHHLWPSPKGLRAITWTLQHVLCICSFAAHSYGASCYPTKFGLPVSQDIWDIDPVCASPPPIVWTCNWRVRIYCITLHGQGSLMFTITLLNWDLLLAETLTTDCAKGFKRRKQKTRKLGINTSRTCVNRPVEKNQRYSFHTQNLKAKLL